MRIVENTKNKIYKSNIFLAVLCALAGLILLFVFDFHLESNDDTLLRSVMCGDYTGTPDAHLVYILYPLGLVFKGLYLLAPIIPWFERFLVVLFLASIYFIGSSFEKGRFTILFLIMSIMLGPLVINQYTQTAGIAIAAALFCFKRKRSIPGAVLLALSFLLRKEVCLAMLPLLGFILISYIAKKELKKHIIPVLCAFAVMGISVAIDSYAYSSPEWKEFKAYNEARTDVFDYNNFPEYGKNIDFYNEIGISAEEYTALAEYDLSLADHDTDTFIAMAEKQKSIIKEWNRFSNPYKRALKAALLAFFENIKTLRGFFACAMLVIGFAVAITDAVRNRKKIPGKLVQILITGGYFVAFIGLFAALGRLPERILFGVNMMAILSGLDVVWNVMAEKRASGIISRIYAFGALVIAVAVFSFQAVRVHAELKAMEEKEAAILEIKDKIASDPNSIYFLEANLYKSCGAKMGEKTGNNKGSLYDPANCVKSSDWLYNSPLMKQRYDNLGITGPFDTTSRKKIYYIVPSGLNFEYIDSIVSEKGVDISVISVVDLLK